MADLDIPIYNIPGNHDNDPYVADDFESENPWRENLGPTYYSFDIGDIHYIQLDNTLFTNTGGAQGTVGKLDYTEGLTADQLRWLEADLQRVPAGKTVFVGMHIQFTNRYRIADGKLSWSYAMPADCRAKMLDLLAPYTVHFVTGHTHINYANRITERMTEHNIAAVCATWWWTGNYTNGRTQMCRDGAPAGYGLFEIEPPERTTCNGIIRASARRPTISSAPTTSTAASSRATNIAPTSRTISGRSAPNSSRSTPTATTVRARTMPC